MTAILPYHCTLAVPLLVAWLLLRLRPRPPASSVDDVLADMQDWVCHAGKRCPPFPPFVRHFLTRPPPYGNELLRSKFPRVFQRRQAVTASLFAKYAYSSGAPTVFFVGANVLGQDENFVRLYRKLVPQTHMVFIEPLPFLQAPLRKAIVGLGANRSSVVAEVAVCETDFENASFYTPDEPRHEDKTLKYGLFHPSLCSSRSKVRVEHDFSYFLTTLQVRCVTPASLLGELQVEPRTIDIMHLDVEAYNWRTLQLFFALEGFAPALIFLEWCAEDSGLTPEDMLEILHSAAARGYDIYIRGNVVIFISSSY